MVAVLRPLFVLPRHWNVAKPAPPRTLDARPYRLEHLTPVQRNDPFLARRCGCRGAVSVVNERIPTGIQHNVPVLYKRARWGVS